MGHLTNATYLCKNLVGEGYLLEDGVLAGGYCTWSHLQVRDAPSHCVSTIWTDAGGILPWLWGGADGRAHL